MSQTAKNTPTTFKAPNHIAENVLNLVEKYGIRHHTTGCKNIMDLSIREHQNPNLRKTPRDTNTASPTPEPEKTNRPKFLIVENAGYENEIRLNEEYPSQTIAEEKMCDMYSDDEQSDMHVAVLAVLPDGTETYDLP